MYRNLTICATYRRKAVYPMYGRSFESSFNTAEWIKTTSTLVYYGGLASADWIILEYQGLYHWKPKSLRKERDGEKIYWSVTGPSAWWTLRARSDRTPTRGCMLFAVVADKLDWHSAERRLEKEKCSFYCVLNQCTWCAYKTPSVLDNCLQLCICCFILIFGLSTLLHACFWGILYSMFKYRLDPARALIGQKPMFYQSITHRKSVFYCCAGVKSIF